MPVILKPNSVDSEVKNEAFGDGILGFWVSESQYRMYHARTGTTRLISIPEAAIPGWLAKNERDDIVWGVREDFAEEMQTKASHMAMDLSTQHGLGATLQDIKESKQHQQESGHGRYW